MKILSLISWKTKSARPIFDWLIKKKRIARALRWSWFQIKMLPLKILKNGWFIKKGFETRFLLLTKSAKSLKSWLSSEILSNIDCLNKKEFKTANLSRLMKGSIDKALLWCLMNLKVILTQLKRYMNSPKHLSFF